MERYNRLLRAVCTALTAAMMAGCAAYLAVRAPGFAISWLPVYLIAAAAAALVQLGRRSTPFMIGCLSAGCCVLIALIAAYLPDIAAMLRDVSQSASLNCTVHAAAGTGMALIAALLLGALFALLLQGNVGSPFALMVMLTAVICALAVNEDLSLWTAMPGLIAGVAAFALPGDVRREGLRPVLLVPALLIALAALALSPAARTTWAPMENLARQVRSIVEDYIRFTEERLAFSINEKGYDHAGLIGDQVVAMLGGPADPTEDTVMRVHTDADMLLRGTIRRSYTGYSWVDDVPKARYLYYDFTHRGVRKDVFDADSAGDLSGFSLHSAEVEMLADGTSTLFVPAQMAEFDMGLADAVYYNSAGEIFLTREVAAGDGYAFSAYLPDDDASLVAACAKRAAEADKGFADARENYTALPGSIDSQVYALAVELTGHTNNAAEKAIAIRDHLAKNYAYTLDGSYPAADQDFVSWFLLEEKQGYCSYFASSMAVMCRIAGIPARYIEGYYVAANPGGETIITGKNAHAWVEVYLNGLGWIAMDPTARARQLQGDAPPGDGYSDHAVEREDGRDPFDGDTAEDPAPTPTPNDNNHPETTPDPGDEGLNNPETSPSPSPEPEDNSGGDASGNDGSDSPDSSGGESPDDPGSNDKQKKPWIWILLVLLLAALLALAVLWVKKRLAATDPLVLSASARSNTMAALILYRSILTLLSQIGMAPLGGEAPEAFAVRVGMSMPASAYEAFVSGVVRSRYSGKGVSRETVNAGRQAYADLLGAMRRSERLRFHVRRIFRGLGSFENIP